VDNVAGCRGAIKLIELRVRHDDMSVELLNHLELIIKRELRFDLSNDTIEPYKTSSSTQLELMHTSVHICNSRPSLSTHAGLIVPEAVRWDLPRRTLRNWASISPSSSTSLGCVRLDGRVQQEVRRAPLRSLAEDPSRRRTGKLQRQHPLQPDSSGPRSKSHLIPMPAPR